MEGRKRGRGRGKKGERGEEKCTSWPAMSSHCTGAPPSKISSRITCVSFGSTPFKIGTFLVGVLLLLFEVVGVPGRRIGEPLPGTDNCLFTEGGVDDGLIGMVLWQG